MPVQEGPEEAQREVIDFLASQGVIAAGSSEVERHDTHGAHVFLAGDRCIKIKRAVRYPYLDFSTLQKRKAAIDREFEINQPNAPDLYLGVLAITRSIDGTLALGGEGEAVEWCLSMQRFPQSALLSNIASGEIPDDVLKAVADEIWRSHQRALRVAGSPNAGLAILARSLGRALEAESDHADAARRFREGLLSELDRCAGLIDRRAQAGRFRRCHGDLHLDNILFREGKATLFDALEFDEAIASVDVMHDLAFLLMDLDVRASRAAANGVLNRYLWRSNEDLDIEALAALPPFLALRAGVRAVVSFDKARLLPGGGDTEERRQARGTGEKYLEAALGYLEPADVRLIAIGGFSGTGKSTLARALAPEIGPAPGALHLRSDLERKAIRGVDEFDRLDAGAYTADESARVYAALERKAGTGLGARHSVIVDAVFGTHSEREAIEAVARDRGCRFDGLWLSASPDQMKQRVALRVQDASDATPDVVERQILTGAGDVGWTIVDASHDAAATHGAALRSLAGSHGSAGCEILDGHQRAFRARG